MAEAYGEARCDDKNCTNMTLPLTDPFTDNFYDIRVPVPPVPEQEKIVKQLDSNLTTLNTALARTEREIGLLREYRTRLVADVVKGKLDVRAAAAKLPAEVESPEESAAGLLEETEPDEAEA